MIHETGEFVVNLTTEHLVFATDYCGVKSGRDVDKVAATGLIPHILSSGAVTFEQARLTIDGRKLFKVPMTADCFVDQEVLNRWYNDKPGGGLHDIYIVEIEQVYER